KLNSINSTASGSSSTTRMVGFIGRTVVQALGQPSWLHPVVFVSQHTFANQGLEGNNGTVTNRLRKGRIRKVPGFHSVTGFEDSVEMRPNL
ncbi:MAG: hypothetical protein ABIP71_15350, partial [Verrucomicrobiota bacterium]